MERWFRNEILDRFAVPKSIGGSLACREEELRRTKIARSRKRRVEKKKEKGKKRDRRSVEARESCRAVHIETAPGRLGRGRERQGTSAGDKAFERSRKVSVELTPASCPTEFEFNE